MTLFATKLQQINESLIGYSQEIEELQLKLEKLREEKKALENHAQQLGSAESAAESALEQVKTALLMVRAIAPAEIATFKGAIDEIFANSEEVAELPASKEEIEEEFIEVNSVEDEEDRPAYVVEETLVKKYYNEDLVEESKIKKYTSKELTAIAKYLNLKPSGNLKQDKIDAIVAHMLEGHPLTLDDIRQALNDPSVS